MVEIGTPEKIGARPLCLCPKLTTPPHLQAIITIYSTTVLAQLPLITLRSIQFSTLVLSFNREITVDLVQRIIWCNNESTILTSPSPSPF